MTIAARVFFIEANDAVRRIPLKRFERFYLRSDSDESFPEYAGQRVRYAVIFVELDNRQPTAIRRIDCSILQLNSKGQLDQKEWLRGVRLGMDSIAPPSAQVPASSVVDATYRFSRKRYHHEFRWKPNAEVMKAIEEAIFGKTKKPLKLV